MKIKIDHLKSLFDKYGERLQIKYLKDLVIRGNCFLARDVVIQDHVPRLIENNVSEVEIFYEYSLYDCLSKEFPNDYRKAFGSMSFLEMDRYLETVNSANNQSKRKRYIQIIGDIYGLDPVEGKRVQIISHNEIIDYKKWNVIKREVDKNYRIYYRNSEIPIIIFVDLSTTTDAGYVERFKKNTDLISIMVSKAGDSEEIISPDFIPTEDVISVTDPNILLEEYIRSNARLIIIGEQLNDSYKRALVNVRKYDKFVRMIVVPTLDHKNLNHFFKQVRLVYNTDRWTE